MAARAVRREFCRRACCLFAGWELPIPGAGLHASYMEGPLFESRFMHTMLGSVGCSRGVCAELRACCRAAKLRGQQMRTVFFSFN